jgi:hypothetical protein
METAAYLMYQGLELKDMKRINGIVWFYFEKSPDTQATFRDFTNNESLQAYINMLNQVRRETRNCKNAE